MLSAIALSLGALASAGEYSPAFFWSPTASAEATSGLEHHAAVSGADLEHISSLYLKGAQTTPELRLVFLAEGLGTEAVRQHAGAMASVEGLLHKSAASLTLPFTTAHEEKKLFARSTARVRGGAEAEQYFKTHAPLFTNGVTDTVVVELRAEGATIEEQLAAHDATIDRVTRVVDSATSGHYAAMLTATRGPAAAHRRLGLKPRAAYLHTHPTLLTAQLVMLILFVIFLSGFCCLFQLQTPKRFESGEKEH
jgi:hypothetical protein